MRILISVVLTAALISFINSPAMQLNNSDGRSKNQAVQAETPRKVSTLHPKQEKTLTEQQAVSKPETVAATSPAVKSVMPAPHTGKCERYRPLLAKYNWDVYTMAAIMRAESSCDPQAVNTQNKDGVNDYGLLQLHGLPIYTPAANIQAGYNIWKRQGYHAWSVYNSGEYLEFL